MSVYHISDVTQDSGRALLDGFSGIYGAAIPTSFRHRSYFADIIVTSSIAPYRNAIVAAQAYHETKKWSRR